MRRRVGERRGCIERLLTGRCETTRCRDTEGKSVVATRARWRVESNSNSSKMLDGGSDECDGAGEMGKETGGGTRIGKAVVECEVDEEESAEGDGGEA